MIGAADVQLCDDKPERHTRRLTKVDANSGTVDFSSWVSIINQTGAAYNNAKLKLVAGDVLSQLDPEDQAGPIGDTVRKIFSITDTRYASAQGAAVDALALESKVDAVLMRLEEKL